MPKASHRHDELFDSQSEAIRMRAVDYVHANHVRCVRKQDTKTEVEELKGMVRMLMDQLKEQHGS